MNSPTIIHRGWTPLRVSVDMVNFQVEPRYLFSAKHAFLLISVIDYLTFGGAKQAVWVAKGKRGEKFKHLIAKEVMAESYCLGLG